VSNLNFRKKPALAVAGKMALTLPIVVGILNVPYIQAQSVAAAAPEFDVASIKPNNAVSGGGRAGPSGGSLRYMPGRVVGTVTARRIITEAYHLTDYQLSRRPGWFDNDRFDIEGRASTPVDENQLRPMLQTLLAERFKLVVHHEAKEMPVYAITIGKNGPKLGEATPGDSSPIVILSKGSDARLTKPAKEGNADYVVVARGSMQHFADMLSRTPSIDRPVLDKTGLHGTYRLFLHWGVDDDIRTAVEEQFGLKFESQKATMDTLVIDHIEKPDRTSQVPSLKGSQHSGTAGWR
jgi:uncharacterized protein (TIGR03435 family)